MAETMAKTFEVTREDDCVWVRDLRAKTADEIHIVPEQAQELIMALERVLRVPGESLVSYGSIIETLTALTQSVKAHPLTSTVWPLKDEALKVCLDRAECLATALQRIVSVGV